MPTLPNSAKLSRWQRNKVVWRVAQEAWDACYPLAFPRYFEDAFMVRKCLGRYGETYLGFDLHYLHTLAYLLWSALGVTRRDLYKWQAKWATRWVWLEWKFRPRIEE